ncbi:hypothetical protein Acsp07_37530 [Actinomycetospora sp. NBRC 106378]|nr:hypothetical protein Acsp07_37530 [Actinomycetospora sp. NBRC 106378]
MPDLDSIRIPLPPWSEQCKIADAILSESCRAQKAEKSLSRLYSLASERVDAQILQLIGLARLDRDDKDGVVPIKRVLQKVTRPVMNEGQVVTAFRDGQVTARSMRATRGYTESASANPQGQGVRVADVVIHGLDGFAGAIGEAETDGNCSSVYHVCTAIGENSGKFHARLLRILATNDYLPLFATSTRERAVDFRNWGLFGSIPIPGVAIRTQLEIAEQISALAPLSALVSKSSYLLRERQRAFVTAAVTGQIDVSTAHGDES